MFPIHHLEQEFRRYEKAHEYKKRFFMAFSSHHLDFQVEQEFSEVSGINPFFKMSPGNQSVMNRESALTL